MKTIPDQVIVTRYESARERDLDHLLMEEFYSNVDFREWFLTRVPSFCPQEPTALAAYRATRRDADQRETDLRFDYLDENNDRFACLLVENKMAAHFRPGQAASYAHEVKMLRAKLGENNAPAVLVAPKRY